MGVVLMLYALATRLWGPSHVSPGDPPAGKKQVRLFALGVLTMWVAADWPIHDLAEKYLFSVHMVQHMVLSLVAPPLILLGTPEWLARKLLTPAPIFFLMKRLGRPLPALLLFNGYLVFSHWPAFVDWTVTHEVGHFLAHLVLVLTSLIMWWPVLSMLGELPRIGAPGQMLYLFGQTIVPTVPASFLTLSEHAFYETYRNAPRIIEGFTAVADQRMAGVIMKLGGGLLLWSIIAVLFFRWSSREERGEPDPAAWQDLERRVNLRDRIDQE